ncbi:cobalt-precorrin-6A reductase [Mycolicibacterium litorale]|nr:cobalt-precorrin-6A reductase [Mycolicibacterium litorale]
MRILLLGGTGEARALATKLHPDDDVISSLAGRVPDPALPVGPVRVGGFGGVDGLQEWLRTNHIGAVVDATHPFAATMTAHAAQACATLGLPHLVLARPAWDPGDAIMVASDTEAARVVGDNRYSRVFLSTGRSGVAPFTGSDAWFLIRVVTPPDPEVLPRKHEVLLSRGPYTYSGELKLLQDNRIDVLVTKNSGGELTRAKLAAADALDVPIVMIDRPPLPAGVATVSTVGQAVDWVRSLG